MSQAIDAGISRRALYGMLDAGVVVRLTRGVYRLASLPDSDEPDLVAVAKRIPRGVICLISALAFHELTTQIPHAVDIAVARGTARPRVSYPPIRVYWFSAAAFETGIQTHVIDKQTVRIYSAEKSIADAFKYRNKIGLDVALEALKTWRERKRPDFDLLLENARACRIESVIRPYLEAIA